MPNFYKKLDRDDSPQLIECMDNILNKLSANTTTCDKPGMLLGKIQSGKTRGFIGVIAKGFDSGYDAAIVLTKGTKTLSEQTVARLNKEFSNSIADDEVIIHDIMKMPKELVKAELSRKIIIVAKKQAQNLEKLVDFINKTPSVKKKKFLIIDDEADMASVRFVVNKNSEIEQGKIADKIDTLRNIVESSSFLQVTATPYSLYLQPDQYENGSEEQSFVFKPKRPAFTELLPVHGSYIGGDDYFGAFDSDNLRSYLYCEVEESEQNALRKRDKRRISLEKILSSKNAKGLSKAIVTFITSTSIRIAQEVEANKKKPKYAMVIHNDTQKAAHEWQTVVVKTIIKEIKTGLQNDDPIVSTLFADAYEDLSNSVNAYHATNMPDFNTVMDITRKALEEEMIIETVNSDSDVVNLLDSNAELRLRTSYSIFIGGSILDRGITIPNLISFYYGRNPKKMQADTVLQHSRMYGNRPLEDLCVTRFHTSKGVYSKLAAINAFENALRSAFERGAHESGVVFIQKDKTNRIRPCAPNKILLSDVVTIQPGGILLPTSFDTKSSRKLKDINTSLLKHIKADWIDNSEGVEVEPESIHKIIEIVSDSFEFEGNEFEWEAMHGILDYYSQKINKATGKVKLYIESGRKLDRDKSGKKSGLSILGPVLRDRIRQQEGEKAVFVLLEQIGGEEKGWSGTKFWWPLLLAPLNVEPCVYAASALAD